jgi:pimeloyl-ACP methyl ester carboxylesterase
MDCRVKDMIKETSQILNVNNTTIRVLHYNNKKAFPILLMHGLTANAYAFNGLIQAGLTDIADVYSLDFRGRGQSAKTPFGYTIKNHAKDVLEILDALGIAKINLCGHSFGGLIATYIAYKHPERVHKVVILDVAPEMNVNAPQMLMPAVGRIDKKYDSFAHFLEELKQAEYLHFWDEAMLKYYEADVRTDANGKVECISNLPDITQISMNVGLEPWSIYFKGMLQESALLVAHDTYTMGQPLLPIEKANKILSQMQNCQLKQIEGNHQTMLFGSGANQIVAFMKKFLSNK